MCGGSARVLPLFIEDSTKHFQINLTGSTLVDSKITVYFRFWFFGTVRNGRFWRIVRDGSVCGR